MLVALPKKQLRVADSAHYPKSSLPLRKTTASTEARYQTVSGGAEECGAVINAASNSNGNHSGEILKALGTQDWD